MNENERSNQAVEDTLGVDDSNDAELATDVLVEEISIDGMCGVY